ncbi:MAG: hypothetical protein WA220_09170, partial [Candidatus Nitrosopolaris sp.]
NYFKAFSNETRLSARDIQIMRAVDQLSVGSNLRKNSLQANRLFESREELDHFVLNVFKLVYQGEDEQQIIKKAFKSGLFEVSKTPLIHFEVNKENQLQFYDSLGLAGFRSLVKHANSPVANTTNNPKTRDLKVYEDTDKIVSLILEQFEDFERAFVPILQKTIDEFQDGIYTLYNDKSSGEVASSERYAATIQSLKKSFSELFYIFDQVIYLYIRRCIILWPKKVSDKSSLSKIYSAVVGRITDMRLLLHQALSSFHGGEFDEYFDDSVLKRTAPMEDVLDHTEIFKGRGLENERDRLVKSVLNIFEE